MMEEVINEIYLLNVGTERIPNSLRYTDVRNNKYVPKHPKGNEHSYSPFHK